MDEYYWEIVERDGTTTRIPPDSVAVVQRRWTEGQPIHTRTRSIPANQIQSFRVTGERYSSVPLIEAAAQAFNDPVQVKLDSGEVAVKARWVKLVVPMERWGRYYSQSIGYKLLTEMNGMAVIAFRKAIHDIDPNKTPYLTDDEINTVDK